MGVATADIVSPQGLTLAAILQVLRQSFFLPFGVKTLATTVTSHGITQKFLLLGTLSDQVGTSICVAHFTEHAACAWCGYIKTTYTNSGARAGLHGRSAYSAEFWKREGAHRHDWSIAWSRCWLPVSLSRCT